MDCECQSLLVGELEKIHRRLNAFKIIRCTYFQTLFQLARAPYYCIWLACFLVSFSQIHFHITKNNKNVHHIWENLFQSPQEPDNWDGIRDATVSGSMCVQTDIFSSGASFAKVYGNEDCLYLNVFSPLKVSISIFMLNVASIARCSYNSIHWKNWIFQSM